MRRTIQREKSEARNSEKVSSRNDSHGMVRQREAKGGSMLMKNFCPVRADNIGRSIKKLTWLEGE